MTVEIPQGAPATIGEAFAHINAVTAPSIDDLKVMVLLEAAGLELYAQMAEGTENPELAELFRENGRQEMGHAHRVAKAIRAISGEDYPPPEPAENPYLGGPIPTAPVTPEALRQLAQGEFAGTGLYETWATGVNHEEAARLFRLNGGEETDHGNRLLAMADMIAA